MQLLLAQITLSYLASVSVAVAAAATVQADATSGTPTPALLNSSGQPATCAPYPNLGPKYDTSLCGQTALGSTCTVKCAAPYNVQMSGFTVQRCMKTVGAGNAQWIGDLPVCVGSGGNGGGSNPLCPAQCPAGPQGARGVGIKSITSPASVTAGKPSTATVLYTDGTQSTLTLPMGAAGAAGAAGPAGAPGARGDPGARGVGIKSITSPPNPTPGQASTATITYTDSTTSTIKLPAGPAGAPGAPGAPGTPGAAGAAGRGIQSITAPTNPTAGVPSTATVTYSDGSTSSLTLPASEVSIPSDNVYIMYTDTNVQDCLTTGALSKYHSCYRQSKDCGPNGKVVSCLPGVEYGGGSGPTDRMVPSQVNVIAGSNFCTCTFKSLEDNVALTANDLYKISCQAVCIVVKPTV